MDFMAIEFVNEYLYLFLVVFVFNIVPAFAPPTWLVLSYFKLKNPSLETTIILFVGLVGATLGRLVMYHYSYFFSSFLPKKNKESLRFIGELSQKSMFKVFLGSFIYSLSPLSSNIMFIFSGAGNINRVPLFLGFFFGRMISYGIALVLYVNTINFVEHSLNFDVKNISDIITLIIAIGLMFVDWKGLYGKLKHYLAK